MEYLQVSADTFYIDVEREHRFEPGDQDQQRDECADRDGDDRGGRDRRGGPSDEHQRHDQHPGRPSLLNRGPEGPELIVFFCHRRVALNVTPESVVQGPGSESTRRSGLIPVRGYSTALAPPL